jgi:hypothetical protein
MTGSLISTDKVIYQLDTDVKNLQILYEQKLKENE